MSAFEEALAKVRTRIERSRSSHPNEQNTKASFIDPILRVLGWDVEDWEEVQREYKVQSGDNPVDYALMDRDARKPLLFIEAKALGDNLSDRKWAGQIMGYAHVAGVRWVVLTNGDRYQIYNAYAEGPVEDKIFRVTQVTDVSSKPVDALELLSKQQVQENGLESIWRSQHVDQKLRATLEALFPPSPDPGLVSLIRRRAPDLSATDVRTGLQRVRLDFPEPAGLVTPAVPTIPPRHDHESTPPGKKEAVKLQDLIRAGLVRPPLTLEKKYKGHALTATVESDGRVRLQDRIFESPSTAAAMARKTIIGAPPGRAYPQTNGWTFWQFRDIDGSVKPLDVLRERYVAAPRPRGTEAAQDRR